MDKKTKTDSQESLLELQQAHKEFVKHLQGLNRSTSTVLAYGKDIDQLIQFVLKEHQIDQADKIEPEHLNAFKDFLNSTGYTAKSISRKINSIKTFFRYLKQQTGLALNPAENVKHPKYETKAPRILTQLEYRALRDAARGDIRTAAIIEILLQTGIRIGELSLLKLQHLHKDQLEVPPYESQPGRTVPLNQAAQTAIENWLAIRPNGKPNDYLFVTKNNRALLVRNIRTSINRYFRLAGIKDAKVNDLRHTWIATHLANGASLVYISSLAGHKRLSTTEKYLNFIKDKFSSASHKLREL